MTEHQLPAPRQRAARQPDVSVHVMPTTPDLLGALQSALTLVEKIAEIEAAQGPADVDTAAQTVAKEYVPENHERHPAAPVLPQRTPLSTLAQTRLARKTVGEERFYFPGGMPATPVVAPFRSAYEIRRLRTAYVLLVVLGHLGSHHSYLGQKKLGTGFLIMTGLAAWQIHQGQTPFALAVVWAGLLADAALLPWHERRSRLRFAARCS